MTVPFDRTGPRRPRPGLLRRAAAHPAAGPLGAMAAAAAGAAYLYGTDPHESGHLLPRCPFNWLTGLLCPVCGATRMAYDLLHADPVRAFHDNALLLVCSPFLLAVAGRWAVAGLRGRRWYPVLGPRAAVAVAGVLVAWAVVRNVR
jgi:uncharacterized protein DUF2752